MFEKYEIIVGVPFELYMPSLNQVTKTSFLYVASPNPFSLTFAGWECFSCLIMWVHHAPCDFCLSLFEFSYWLLPAFFATLRESSTFYLILMPTHVATSCSPLHLSRLLILFMEDCRESPIQDPILILMSQLDPEARACGIYMQGGLKRHHLFNG